MQNKVEGILRAVNKKEKAYNILTFPTHEAYQSNWSDIPHTFYLWQGRGIKNWNSNFRKLPENHILLNGSEDQIKSDMKFDIVLSQNKFGQFEIANYFAKNFNIPLVSIEHTLPVPQWGQRHRKILTTMRGKVNIFISEFSIGEWGFLLEDPSVRIIHHAINTNIFKPSDYDRENNILSVVNDWPNRDWCCGWTLYNEIKSYTYSNSKFIAIGDSKGFSEPAKSTQELVEFYNRSKIFLNTSLISPIPTALLEAMACGCACVTTDTCMIPTIIKDGYNGYLYSPNKGGIAADRIQYLLENPDKAKEIGENARKTIIEKFSLKNHLDNWNKIFDEVIGTGY